MRLPVIQSANSVASVTAGALIGAAVCQTSLLVAVLLAAGGVLLFLATSILSWLKTKSSFGSVVEPVSYTHLTLPTTPYV